MASCSRRGTIGGLVSRWNDSLAPPSLRRSIAVPRKNRFEKDAAGNPDRSPSAIAVPTARVCFSADVVRCSCLDCQRWSEGTLEFPSFHPTIPSFPARASDFFRNSFALRFFHRTRSLRVDAREVSRISEVSTTACNCNPSAVAEYRVDTLFPFYPFAFVH